MSDQQIPQPKADIGRQQIGGVYAKAFLAASANSNTVEQDLDEFGELLTSVIDHQPAFEATLASPRVAVKDKTDLLDKALAGRATDGLLKFLKVVCRHGRLDCLREIYRAARRQHNDSRGIVQVHVTTAQALDDATSDHVRGNLAQHLQHEVLLEKHVDPAVIGGMIIRIGDLVYDSSVRQRLTSIRQHTVEKTAQQMRDSIHRFATSN